jgi:hypothetical protein
MKLDIQFLPTDIPEANLAASVVSKLNSGGSGSPNTFVPTSKADLENVSNANKIADLQTDIDLGGLDVALADGITLYSSGGTLTNYGIITCSNTNFDAYSTKQAILDDSGTVAGTYNVDEIWLDWFGAKTDAESTLYDNEIAIKNALKTVNYKGGTLRIGSGKYYTSVYARYIYLGAIYGNTNANIEVSNTVTIKGMGWENTTIQALTNELASYSLIEFRGGSGASIEDLELRGDLETRISINNEQCHGIVISTADENVTVKNCKLNYFSGDGLVCPYDVDMANDWLVWELGGINDSGVDEVDSNRYRSAIKSLRTPQLERRNFMLTGGSYAGYETMPNYNFECYFYDNLDAFISKTGIVEMHKKIIIPDNAVKYRIQVAKFIGDVIPVGKLQMRSPRIPYNTTVIGCDISFNYRDGISNLAQGARVLYNNFHDNGGRVGGPSYDLNIEDGYMENNDILIEGNTFENAVAGSISLRWAKDIRIINNTFLGNTNPDRTNRQDINARETWDCVISGNRMHSTDVQLGRKSKMYDNILFNSTIQLANSYGEAVGNLIYDGGIYINGDASAAPGRSLSKNNTFFITYEQSNADRIEIYGGRLTIVDDVINFENDIWVGSNKVFKSSPDATTDLYERSIDGLVINGQNAQYPHQEGIYLLPQNISNSSFSGGLQIAGGQARDFVLENNKYTGFVHIDNLNTLYTNTGTATNTIIIDGGKITGSVLYSNFQGRCGVRTDALDINLVVKNLEIDMTDANGGRFIGLNHNGTTLLKNCSFINDTNIMTIADTDSSTTNPIVFEDCNFNGMTVSLNRTVATDVIRYTKPDSNCPSYADNTTALAALGEGYYYKNTTSGTFEVTNL